MVGAMISLYYLICTPTCSLAMLVLQKHFCGGRRKRWRRYARRDLSSTQRKTANEAWRPKCAASRLGLKQDQKAAYYCSYLGHQKEVNFVGGISERRPKSEPFVYLSLWYSWAYIYLGRREGWRKGVTQRGGASCRELLEDQVLSCCVINQVSGGGREMEGGGSVGKGWMAGGTRQLGFLFQ